MSVSLFTHRAIVGGFYELSEAEGRRGDVIKQQLNSSSSNDLNVIIRFYNAAIQYSGEESFLGHDAIACLVVDGTTGMTLLADLSNLH